jgi:hypothetical protein
MFTFVESAQVMTYFKKINSSLLRAFFKFSYAKAKLSGGSVELA